MTKHDKFIECALTGEVDYIVSGDRHLLELKKYRGIKILTPTELRKKNRYSIWSINPDVSN
ncbi:MAG: hypothetical protein ABH874_05365 [Methanobacteriota archaeon]